MGEIFDPGSHFLERCELNCSRGSAVIEAVVVARSKDRASGIVIAGFGLEEVGGGYRCDFADSFVGFVEPFSYQIGPVCSGGGTEGCAGERLGGNGWVVKMEEGIGEMSESV